jgi:SCY1-like protein 1
MVVSRARTRLARQRTYRQACIQVTSVSPTPIPRHGSVLPTSSTKGNAAVLFLTALSSSSQTGSTTWVSSRQKSARRFSSGFDFLHILTTCTNHSSDLDQLTDDFPEDFFKMKVLPELLKSVEFGGGGPKAFGLVIKIAAKMSNDDFDSRVTPVVIRLFGNPDRAIRVCLLDNLPAMIDRLSQRAVNDKIFPQIVSLPHGRRKLYEMRLKLTLCLQVTGFTDVAPLVREQTLKSVLTLIGKLSDRTINGELLRYLAKTANDEQPGIRTNTTICLGKIAKNLGASSRSKVLIAAFTRSLRDPFVHARNAALMALAVTGDYFSEEDAAARIMPFLCPLLIDKEKLIRDQASKTLEVYLQKIKKAAAGMPETALPPETAVTGGPRMSTPQPSDSSAAASWAGWAISSFTNKLSTAAGEIQSASNGSAAPGKRPTPNSQPSSSSASALHRQAVKSPPPSAPMSRASSRGHLGGESFFPDPEPVQDDDGDAWGDMDDGAGGADFWNDDAAFPPQNLSSSTTLPKRKAAGTAATTTGASASATPFDDGSEPDFAGWLAAQANKKTAAGGKGLPKGLAKSSSSTATPAAKKPGVGGTKPKAAPAPAKKIDMKPKQTDDDDGWGDGW